MLAAQDPDIAAALLLLSYPLHPPDKPENMRTNHFPSLQTPALFVSGERDGFGTCEELQTALKLIPARTELMIVTNVGHELISKKNQQELRLNVASAFLNFVKSNQNA